MTRRVQARRQAWSMTDGKGQGSMWYFRDKTTVDMRKRNHELVENGNRAGLKCRFSTHINCVGPGKFFNFGSL